MTTQLLIYETAVPVSSGRHAKASVEAGSGYGFARRINSAPLMAVEFPQAAPEYAIVFAQNGEEVVPVVILGARAGENLYLAEDDSWTASYLPAFVRRYPFIFSAGTDGTTFTLCVDEAFQGLNYLGRGQPLFIEGKQSPYVDNVLKFLQEYRAQFLRTQAFCRRLVELKLLEPMRAQFTLAGEQMSLGGFQAVDRARLRALSGEDLAKLASTDELELLYLHLQSMRNFSMVKDKLMLTRRAEAAAEPAAGSEPADDMAEPAADQPRSRKAARGGAGMAAG
jgi:hypothetical protein